MSAKNLHPEYSQRRDLLCQALNSRGITLKEFFAAENQAQGDPPSSIDELLQEDENNLLDLVTLLSRSRFEALLAKIQGLPLPPYTPDTRRAFKIMFCATCSDLRLKVAKALLKKYVSSTDHGDKDPAPREVDSWLHTLIYGTPDDAADLLLPLLPDEFLASLTATALFLEGFLEPEQLDALEPRFHVPASKPPQPGSAGLIRTPPVKVLPPLDDDSYDNPAHIRSQLQLRLQQTEAQIRQMRQDQEHYRSAITSIGSSVTNPWARAALFIASPVVGGLVHSGCLQDLEQYRSTLQSQLSELDDSSDLEEHLRHHLSSASRLRRLQNDLARKHPDEADYIAREVHKAIEGSREEW